MPKKEIIVSEKLSPGRAPLSQATRFGDLVFVQGCTGRHPSSGEVGQDIKEQTRYALDRILDLLRFVVRNRIAVFYPPDAVDGFGVK